LKVPELELKIRGAETGRDVPKEQSEDNERGEGLRNERGKENVTALAGSVLSGSNRVVAPKYKSTISLKARQK
jgi:hypothetical protein